MGSGGRGTGSTQTSGFWSLRRGKPQSPQLHNVDRGLVMPGGPPSWVSRRSGWTWFIPPQPQQQVLVLTGWVSGSWAKDGALMGWGHQDADPGRAGAPGTLLQSRRPSRQRQLLQSSTQELPCGKGTPLDQQGLPNTTTVGTAEGSAIALRPGGQVSPCPHPARAPPTLLAPWAGPAGRAATAVAVDLIHTRGPIRAGGGLALVDVCGEGAGSAGSRATPPAGPGPQPRAAGEAHAGQQRHPR